MSMASSKARGIVGGINSRLFLRSAGKWRVRAAGRLLSVSAIAACRAFQRPQSKDESGRLGRHGFSVSRVDGVSPIWTLLGLMAFALPHPSCRHCQVWRLDAEQNREILRGCSIYRMRFLLQPLKMMATADSKVTEIGS